MKPKGLTNNKCKHKSIGTKSSAASSTRSIKATFFNGKQLDIQYIFDPSKIKTDRVLIAMNCILPVFGGFVNPDMNKFLSITVVIRLISMHAHLNMCSDKEHASCPCHLRRSSEELNGEFEKSKVEECKYEHFHHYCSVHVASWFKNYLFAVILFKESRQLFDDEVVGMLLDPDLEDLVYLGLGERAIGKFLLAHALKI
ncbi:Rep3 [Hyposoter didymator ichnovirus]|nr:Rep3 [Hyposoter didymator ichnovirus]